VPTGFRAGRLPGALNVAAVLLPVFALVLVTLRTVLAVSRIFRTLPCRMPRVLVRTVCSTMFCTALRGLSCAGLARHRTLRKADTVLGAAVRQVRVAD
jgi:hypothetical protein